MAFVMCSNNSFSAEFGDSGIKVVSSSSVAKDRAGCERFREALRSGEGVVEFSESEISSMVGAITFIALLGLWRKVEVALVHDANCLGLRDVNDCSAVGFDIVIADDIVESLSFLSLSRDLSVDAAGMSGGLCIRWGDVDF
jgi:hypothetical protein